MKVFLKKILMLLVVVVVVAAFLFIPLLLIDPVWKLRYDYQTGKPVVVGVIGDSIACGFRANNWREIGEKDERITPDSQNNPNIGGWAQQLQVWLKQKNPNSIVYNVSGSGWTTEMVLDRGSVKKLALMVPKPTVVFISLVVNDRYKDKPNIDSEVGMAFSQYPINLAAICKQCRDYGMTPVLVQEINEPLPAGAGWKYAEYPHRHRNPGIKHHAYSEYIQLVKTVAHSGKFYKRNIYVIDVYSNSLNHGNYPRYIYRTKDEHGKIDNSPGPEDYRSDLYTMEANNVFDPIHPNQAGHDLILTQYKKFFLTSWL